MSQDNYPDRVFRVRDLSMPILLRLLDGGPKTVQEVYPHVQIELGQGACDDAVRCEHDPKALAPEAEWRHRVRHGLNSLRAEGFCFNTAPARPWVRIGLNEFVVEGRSMPVTERTRFRLKERATLRRGPSLSTPGLPADAGTVVGVSATTPVVDGLRIWLAVGVLNDRAPATPLWIRKRDLLASYAEWQR